MLRKFYYSILLVLSAFPQIVYGSKIDLPAENYGLPTTEGKGFPVIAGRVINYASGVAATLAVVFIIYAAFMYLTAGGDEEKAKKAKMTIVWTLVGLVILIFSWSIVSILLGLNAFSTAAPK